MSTLVPLTGFGDNYKVYNTGDRVYYENGSNSFSYDKSQADQMAFLVASGQISPNSLQAQAALNLLGGSNPYANKTSSELSTSGYGSNFTLQSPDPRTQESWAKTAAGGAKPDIKTFMDKTGVDFQTASNIIYGNVGSNNDTRNWASIMSSANPVQEAQQGLQDMYGGITTQSVQTGVDSNGKPTYSDMFVAGNGTVLSSINDATYSNGNDGRYSLSYGQSGVSSVTPRPTNPFTDPQLYDQEPLTPTSTNQQQSQQPSWMGQWQTMQDQFNQMMQGWQTQQQAQQPSYGYNGSNTSYNYQPVYSNPLMRPVTANANIAPQQAPSNMGYQNRTSLWSDV